MTAGPTPPPFKGTRSTTSDEQSLRSAPPPYKGTSSQPVTAPMVDPPTRSQPVRARRWWLIAALIVVGLVVLGVLWVGVKQAVRYEHWNPVRLARITWELLLNTSTCPPSAVAPFSCQPPSSLSQDYYALLYGYGYQEGAATVSRAKERNIEIELWRGKKLALQIPDLMACATDDEKMAIGDGFIHGCFKRKPRHAPHDGSALSGTPIDQRWQERRAAEPPKRTSGIRRPPDYHEIPTSTYDTEQPGSPYGTPEGREAFRDQDHIPSSDNAHETAFEAWAREHPNDLVKPSDYHETTPYDAATTWAPSVPPKESAKGANADAMAE